MTTAVLHAAAFAPESVFGASVSSSVVATPSGVSPRRSTQAQANPRHGDKSAWDTRAFELTFELAVSIFVVSAFIIVFVIVSSMVVCRAGRRHPSRIDLEAAKRQIDAAEIDRRFPGTNVDDEPMCAVCLLQIELDEPCRVTDCGHVFHADCILQWWTHKPHAVLHCPVCRQKQRRHAPSDASQQGHEKRLRKQQFELREWDNEKPPMQFQPCHRRLTPPQHGWFPCDRPRMEESEEEAAPVEDPKADGEEHEGQEQAEREGDSEHEFQEEEEEGEAEYSQEEEVEEQEAFLEASTMLAI